MNHWLKKNIGPKHSPLDGTLEVKPKKNQDPECRCEMTAPMTAPLCCPQASPVLIEIGEPFGKGSNRVGSSKMGWRKAKPIKNNRPKSQRSDSKKDENDSIRTITTSELQNQPNHEKSPGTPLEISGWFPSGIKAPRSALNSAKLGRHWTLLAMAPRALPHLGPEEVVGILLWRMVISWDLMIKNGALIWFSGNLRWRMVISWDLTINNAGFMVIS